MIKIANQVAGDRNIPTPPKRTVEEWVSAIDELIGQQKRTVFDIGDMLIRAETELRSKKKFRDVVKASGLKSKQNANNYMRVARAGHLRNPDVFPHLPTTVGALIDLAAWDDGPFGEGIRMGIIHPQSQRNQLKKWLHWWYFRTPIKQPPDNTAQVVGYIVCDTATYSFDRAYELWDSFDDFKLKCLPEDMHITPYENDVLSQHRLEQLGKRVWTAYANDPALFVDPKFCKLVEREGINEGCAWLYLKEVAPIIASGDHTPLHKVIKFSKSDWKFLGVTDVGYATLLAYFA